MTTEKKPAGLTAEQSVIFYGSKMSSLDKQLNNVDLMSSRCEHVDYARYDELRGSDNPQKTCNQKIYSGIEQSRCAGCEENSTDYKFKRKLKQQFGVAQKQMIKFIRKLNKETNFLYSKEG